MCGGIGSRFWPFSRAAMPKQFLDFFGTGRSLLQMTFDRVLPVVPAERIIIVTNEQYAPMCRQQLPEIPEANILCEPARRNTAPCICWASHHIAALDPRASIVTLPSDHIVLKEETFQRDLLDAFEFVEANDALLTLGIKPTSPNTGYGYIQRGAPVKDWPGVMKVRTFTEKPNLEMAEIFLKSGEFFWNAGIFLWTAKAILEAFNRYDTETAALFNRGRGLYNTVNERRFIDEAYPKAPSISIDYAIMEKADNVFVKTVDIGWSDVGTWRALRDISPQDAESNVTRNCRVIAHDCHDTIFASTGERLIVAAGLDGYIVAENGNALLIYPADEEQKIRQIVNEVKNRFGEEFL